LDNSKQNLLLKQMLNKSCLPLSAHATPQVQVSLLWAQVFFQHSVLVQLFLNHKRQLPSLTLNGDNNATATAAPATMNSTKPLQVEQESRDSTLPVPLALARLLSGDKPEMAQRYQLVSHTRLLSAKPTGRTILQVPQVVDVFVSALETALVECLLVVQLAAHLVVQAAVVALNDHLLPRNDNRITSFKNFHFILTFLLHLY
jgi:hypothetical protein